VTTPNRGCGCCCCGCSNESHIARTEFKYYTYVKHTSDPVFFAIDSLGLSFEVFFAESLWARLKIKNPFIPSSASVLSVLLLLI
jgi:hypothetical protein